MDDVRKDLSVEPLLHANGIQLRWCGYWVRVPHGWLPLKVFHEQPTGDIIIYLASERFRFTWEEVESFAGEKDASSISLACAQNDLALEKWKMMTDLNATPSSYSGQVFSELNFEAGTQHFNIITAKQVNPKAMESQDFLHSFVCFVY